MRPNHFFAVRISDRQIVEGVEHVQNSIVQLAPHLKSALVPASTLHVTLAVADLSTVEHFEKANEVLVETVRQFASPLEIQLAQVGHFDNRVVYARVTDDGEKRLGRLWASLRDGCQSAGVPLIDGDRFTPHVTLLKLSKDPWLRRKGIKVVAPHLYQTHVERVFGRQVIESVQLLSMTEPKDDAGYYAMKSQFHFGEKNEGML